MAVENGQNASIKMWESSGSCLCWECPEYRRYRSTATCSWIMAQCRSRSGLQTFVLPKLGLQMSPVCSPVACCRARLLVANLGDSRAVLGRQQAAMFIWLVVVCCACRLRSEAGRLGAVRLSDDHKPGRPDEQRRIESNGGVVDMQAALSASVWPRKCKTSSHAWPSFKGVWRVFTPGPATFGGRSLLWGLAVSRAFGDLLMKDRLPLAGRTLNC